MTHTARTSRPSARTITSPLRSVAAAAMLVTLATATHCSHGPRRASPPEDAEAESVALPSAGHDVETIAIVGTNDIHGALASQELKTRETEGVAPTDYRAGGVAVLSSYLKVLREEFGRSLIWLDAGDEFQGSLESNLDQGAPMVDFFNAALTASAAVGNHEFDFGPSKEPGADPKDRLGALKARLRQARYPYLSANIMNRATGKLADDLLPGLLPYKLVDTGKVKVGVIGLSTEETPRTTSSVNLHGLAFSSLKDATMSSAEALRKAGADLVVITAHVGLKCERGRASAASHMRKPTEPQGDCGARDEMVRLLKSVPTGTVDAVVAGHSHQVVHHWVAGVPVIQGGAFGRYFNVIYLNYDVKERKLLTDLTRIEGPVPVCPKVFQNQNDCNGDRPPPKGGRGALVPTQFHGETIAEDDAVVEMLRPVYAKTAAAKKEVVAHAARPIDHDRFKESGLGNLVADAMRDVTGAQVAIMNSGGIRSNWEQGAITYGDVFRTFPFDNRAVKVKVSGRELKTILRLAESGSRGFFSVSGLRLKLLPMDADAPSNDLNRDGRVDAWEVNRLRGVTLEDGSEIRDDAWYTLATLDFLLTGGDDLGWAMAQIPIERQDPPAELIREAVLARMRLLAKSGELNSTVRPLINPADPRMKFEKPEGKSKKSRKSRTGKGSRSTRRR